MKFLIIVCLLVASSFSQPLVPRPKRDVNILQDKLIQVLHPQPIVDTMTEAEKCCNHVQHVIGKKFIDTYDQISQFIGSKAQMAIQTKNTIGGGLTSILDMIGGKLVGLQ